MQLIYNKYANILLLQLYNIVFYSTHASTQLILLSLYQHSNHTIIKRMVQALVKTIVKQ